MDTCCIQVPARSQGRIIPNLVLEVDKTFDPGQVYKSEDSGQHHFPRHSRGAKCQERCGFHWKIVCLAVTHPEGFSCVSLL